MNKNKLYLLTLILYCPIYWANTPHPKNPLRFSKINTGILLQRYYFNSFHSKDVTSGSSFLLGYHQELTLDGIKNKNFFSIGLEYLYQSFSFDSYYFTQDTFRLYNGKMNFSYQVKLNELNIPLIYKHNFSRENNDVHGIYFSIGLVYRIILPSYMSVSSEGRAVNSYDIRPVFKIPVLNPYTNSYFHGSVGFQKNHPQGNMKMFFEIFCRYGFSPVLINTAQSASNLYFGNYFIGVSFGFKWRRK